MEEWIGRLRDRKAWTKAPEHDAYHRQPDPVLARPSQRLVVFRQPSTSVQPSECALDYPPVLDYAEFVLLRPAYDLES